MGLCRLASSTAVLKNPLHFLNFHTMCQSCFLPCAEAGDNFSEPCAESLLHRVPAHSKFDFPSVCRALLCRVSRPRSHISFPFPLRLLSPAA